MIFTTESSCDTMLNFQVVHALLAVFSHFVACSSSSKVSFVDNRSHYLAPYVSIQNDESKFTRNVNVENIPLNEEHKIRLQTPLLKPLGSSENNDNNRLALNERMSTESLHPIQLTRESNSSVNNDSVSNVTSAMPSGNPDNISIVNVTPSLPVRISPGDIVATDLEPIPTTDKTVHGTGSPVNNTKDHSYQDGDKINISSEIASIIETLIKENTTSKTLNVTKPWDNTNISNDRDIYRISEKPFKVLNDTMEKKTRFRFDYMLPANSNSPLQQLLSKNKKLTVQKDNITGTESSVSTKETAVVHILRDIKNILKTSKTEIRNSSLNNLKHKYEALELKTIEKVNVLQSKFSVLTDNTNQKMSLIMDNLSILKLLVTSQESRVQSCEHRITDHINEYKKTINIDKQLTQKSSDLLQPFMKLNDSNEEFSHMNILSNITKDILDNKKSIDSTLFTVSEKLSKLESSIVSYEEKFNLYRLKDSPEHINFISNATLEDLNEKEKDSACACVKESSLLSTESLKDTVNSQSESIQILEATTATLKEYVEEIKKSDMLGIHPPKEIDNSIDEKIGLMISDAAEDTNSKTSQNNSCANLSERVEQLETEVQAVPLLRAEVEHLKTMLDELHNKTSESMNPTGANCGI